MSSASESGPGSARNAALAGPVTGREPDFLGALPSDNVVGALVALTAEVCILRERLLALEAELGARRVLPPDAVELHRGTPEQAQARQRDLAALTERVLSELARDRTPTSTIDPDVARFMATFEQLGARRER